MSGDFISVFDKLAAGALSPQVEAQCRQARAAIAEPIAADREYDEARTALYSCTEHTAELTAAVLDTAQRRAAALAAVTAQGAGSVTGQHKSNPEQSEDCRGGEVSDAP